MSPLPPSTMWCTRWFLPLLLLPLPTAPPYFLILFLFSLTLHAKPCFYCVVLLTTLFVSSCYWQPFPIDTPLIVPWSATITTFSQALNATLAPNYTKPLPLVMRAVDRCWCDFSSGSFFEPFNVSRWEHLSVQRLKNDLARQKIQEDLAASNGTEVQTFFINDTDDEQDSAINSNSVSKPNSAAKSWLWSRILRLSEKPSSPTAQPSSVIPNHPKTFDRHEKTRPTATPAEATSSSNSRAPLLRQEYDLQSYGLGMVIDLRWSR